MSAALAPVRSQGSVQQFSQDTVQRLAKELAGNGAPPTGAQRARRYGGAALVLLDRFLGRVHHNAGDLVASPLAWSILPSVCIFSLPVALPTASFTAPFVAALASQERPAL